MLVVPLAQLPKRLLAIHQFTAFGLRKAMLDFRGNICAIVGQPLFVFMQHLNGSSNEFIGGLVGAALHIFLNERFELRLEMNRHTCQLPMQRWALKLWHLFSL